MLQSQTLQHTPITWFCRYISRILSKQLTQISHPLKYIFDWAILQKTHFGPIDFSAIRKTAVSSCMAYVSKRVSLLPHPNAFINSGGRLILPWSSILQTELRFSIKSSLFLNFFVGLWVQIPYPILRLNCTILNKKCQ